MKKIPILLYFCLCAIPVSALAQNQMPMEQWQLTFDVVKSKVQTLLEENNRLTSLHQELLAQVTKVQKSVEEQEKKKAAAQEFLAKRGNKTDQQLQIEKLESKLKDVRSKVPERQTKADDLKKQASQWQQKNDLLKLKISELELRQSTAVVEKPKPVEDKSTDAELDTLRKDLEEQKAKEASLEAEITALRTGKDEIIASAKVADEEIKGLKEKIKALVSEKADLTLQLEKSDAKKSEGQRRYQEMVRRKDDLETKIGRFEARINELKDPSIGMTWTVQKKQLIHDIVAMDAQNTQLRQKVNELREDIMLLQDQVGSLEQRAQLSGKGR